jgi:polyisoprenoid-binding protein YceI
MKQILLSALTIIAAITANAQTNWSLDNSHSNVKFTITHMIISELEGNFKTYNGTVTSAADDFQNANIEFNVDVNSINTDDEKRDGHLKGADFFNAEKFPMMKFKSTSFKKVNEKNYSLEGDLTIREVTKKVKFDVVYNGLVKDPWGNTKAGFKAKSKINRFDYGLKWNAAVEAGGLVVSNEVEISLNIELKKN